MTVGGGWVDLFAGAGGWDVGARALGIDPLGIEFDPDACATRRAAGLPTVGGDVSKLDPETFHMVNGRRTVGLIASPPCQSYSNAGSRAGIRDADLVLSCLSDLAAGRDTRFDLAGEFAPSDDALFGFAIEDTRSLLVVEALRWAMALMPRWIALEQVPAVLPVWERIAEHLRALGYSTWCGRLRSDEFGVPQTRERAIMLADLDGPVTPPVPTHQRWAKGVAPAQPTDAAGRLPWVTMAEALGWWLSQRPSVTLASVSGGGRRPLDGGSGARQTLVDARERGEWVRHSSEPDPAVVLRSSNQAHATTRAIDEPAMTVATAKLSLPEWTSTRPATVIAGDRRVQPPGHKSNAADPPGKYDGRAGKNAVQINIDEAAVLQGFPERFPGQGHADRAVSPGRQCGPATDGGGDPRRPHTHDGRMSTMHTHHHPHTEARPWWHYAAAALAVLAIGVLVTLAVVGPLTDTAPVFLSDRGVG